MNRDSVEAEPKHGRHATHEFVTHHQLALMAIDLALIVAGSFGMVQAALTLGDRWGIASGLVGALILGPLTSLPNALTGIRLGLARRGAALVTEALNSNTINLVAGVALPSLFVTLDREVGEGSTRPRAPRRGNGRDRRAARGSRAACDAPEPRSSWRCTPRSSSQH